MRRALIGAGVVAVLVGTAACSGGSGTSGAGGGGSKTLTLSPLVPAQPWDLKDAGLGNNTQYYQPVYDSLLRLDTKAEPIPNVATKWAYDSTNTVLTLTLRTGITFTDGTALDAAAVKENLEHTKTGSNEAAGQLKNIKTVEAVGADTVKVTLSAPDPSFVANLGSVAGMLASPKAIAAGTLKNAPVGSGPYTLDKGATTNGSVYTFVRNKGYWNTKAFPFDKIVFKPLTDPTAVLNALRSGQIDGALITTPKNVAVAKSGGLNILQYLPGDVAGVYIWDRAGKIVPALGKLKVRQAINYAFDRTAFIKSVYGGVGKPTVQVFNPTSTAYDATLNDTYSYDPAKAKSLLAEAGYPNGFSVSIPDLSAIFPEAQAAMVQQLADVGIKCKLVTVPPGQTINQLLAGKFALSYFSLASFRSWDTVRIQVAPDALWNIFKDKDPALTKLIDSAQKSTGATQDADFKKIDDYLVQQAWNAPWANVENSYATSKHVKVTAQAFTPVPGIYNFTPAG
ncbi:ABC transporter substrate-binding protein [Streptomyces xylophagus]|uniref:ABC transporter substrate-binding protein n=1 Tax=Streptomyces xylophagus TaxID=285514 RepID=UPI0005B85D37|nr:ABC transporter substrate-binding protein [Streptomyces xylophagus]